MSESGAMKFSGIGIYRLDCIKYFNPDGLNISLECPECGEIISFDAGDGWIEYPKPRQTETIECDCGREITLDVRIQLTCTVDIDYE